MRKIMTFAIILVTLTGFAQQARYVSTTGSDGTGDGSFLNPYLTIQKGIDMSNTSDSVVVMQGLYMGAGNTDINFSGKAIAVLPYIGGAGFVVIDCEHQTDGFVFNSGEGDSSKLAGMYIKNAYNGVYCENGSPQILYCIIDSCDYGIMSSNYSVPNSPLIARNLIRNATYDGIQVFENGTPAIVQNTIVGCQSAGIYAGFVTVLIKDNIIVDCLSGIVDGVPGSTTIYEAYNLLWNNTTDFDGFTPSGFDILADPLFVAPGTDYTLQQGSPAIDSGDPTFQPDPDGTRADIGAYDYDQGCEASFEYSVTGSDVTLNNTSPAFTSILWDFGDEQFSTDTNLTQHNFATAGYFNVCLTIMTSTGCQAEYCEMLEISPPASSCLARFNFDTTSTPNEIWFHNNSIGNANKWLWNYGDGSTSYEEAAYHTFPGPGIYNVFLTIYNTTTGCTDITSHKITVGDPLSDCEAEFTYLPNLSNTSVSFDNCSFGSVMTHFLWSFGDGDTSKQINPTHIFPNTGYFDVCLHGVSPYTGCKNTTCKTIRVGNDPNAVSADFLFHVDTNTRQVGYINRSRGAADSHLWVFGDSSGFLMTVNALHTYQASGYYLTLLREKNTSTGKTAFRVKAVNVGMPVGLKAMFGYVVDTTYNKSNQYPADFKGAAFGDPAVISWDFGDGNTDSTSMTPTHFYADSGYYNVCLTVSDPNSGLSNQLCRQVYVNVAYNGIAENQPFEIEVFPNPADRELTISAIYQGAPEMHVRIFSPDGRIVKEARIFGVATMDISDLAPGFHILQIETVHGTTTRKIVIE
ncbi:MAG: PKD domain-containing protein [Bacteroidetes bacterium]|nr:PKD domain-containing protein [Bacteroidota bacterium]MBU1719395.1 PKD domain-containing protein [Bacteroidota bacterium]